MTEYLFANKAETTLAANIAAGDSSFAVASGTSFPEPTTGQAFYVVVVEDETTEWMLVGSRSGNTFSNITRGSSPFAFSAGATVRFVANAVVVGQFEQTGTFRTVSTDPDGSLAPEYSGEEVFQSATKQWWKNIAGTEWKEITNEQGEVLSVVPDAQISNDGGWCIYDGFVAGSTAALFSKVNSGVDTPTDNTMIGLKATEEDGTLVLEFADPGSGLTGLTLRIRAYSDTAQNGEDTFGAMLRDADGNTFFDNTIGQTPYAWKNVAGDGVFHNYEITIAQNIGLSAASAMRLHLDGWGVAMGHCFISEIEIRCETGA